MSKLQLLNINFLNNTYENTIDFASEEAQNTYFTSRVFTSLDLGDDYAYVRERQQIVVDFTKDQLQGVNYLRFNNDNKWWYAFIISKDYVNESCTQITFEIDVMQTFMFDYTIDEAFVLREHQDRFTTTGVPIFNRENEGLAYGDHYIEDKDYNTTIVQRHKNDISNSSFNQDVKSDALTILSNLKWYVIYTKQPIDPNNENDKNIGCIINGVRSPFNTYLLPILDSNIELTYNWSITGFGSPIYGLTTQLPQRLVSDPNVIKIAPIKYLPFDTTTQIFARGGTIDYELSFLTFGHSQELQAISILVYDEGSAETITLLKAGNLYSESVTLVEDPLTFDLTNYNINAPAAIKYETKLKIQPYYNLTLFTGNTLINYDITQFRNLVSQLKYFQAFDYSTKLVVYPYAYEGVFDNILRAVTKDAPELNLTTDQWLQYQSQNAETHEVSKTMGALTAVTAIGGSVAGLATGNPLALVGAFGATLGAIGKVASQQAKENDIKNAPDDPRISGSSVVIENLINELGVTTKAFTIEQTFANKLWHFFTHFGYKVNDYKKPNLKSRYYYNYIQMDNLTLTTQIDNDYINQIKGIYSRGITLWHYRDNETFKGVGVYYYENVEVAYMEAQNG